MRMERKSRIERPKGGRNNCDITHVGTYTHGHEYVISYVGRGAEVAHVIPEMHTLYTCLYTEGRRWKKKQANA